MQNPIQENDHNNNNKNTKPNTSKINKSTRVMEHTCRSGLVKGIGRQFSLKSGFKNGDGGRSLNSGIVFCFFSLPTSALFFFREESESKSGRMCIHFRTRLILMTLLARTITNHPHPPPGSIPIPSVFRLQSVRA